MQRQVAGERTLTREVAPSEECVGGRAGLTLVSSSKSLNGVSTQKQALEILDEAGDYTVKLQSSLFQTVGLYRSGDVRKAGESFVGLVQSLDTFVRILSVVEHHLRVDFTATTYQDSSLLKSVEHLNRVFLEIVDAQERQDLVFLADILEYELVPRLVHWRDIFNMLRDQAAAGPTEGL